MSADQPKPDFIRAESDPLFVIDRNAKPKPAKEGEIRTESDPMVTIDKSQKDAESDDQ